MTPPAPDSPPATRPRRGPPAIAYLAIVLFVSIFGLGAAIWWTTVAVERPFKAWTGEAVFVEVPQGAGVIAIARRLTEAGVVERPWMFRLSAWQQGAERRLRAGEYRFDRAISPRRVVETLARGDVYLQPITFREGLAIDEMAAVFAKSGLGTGPAFIAAAAIASPIADLDSRATTLEGYLFPDTYQLPRRTAAATLVDAMVSRFRGVVGPDGAARAAARGLTVREWVTLASIIEKETGRDDERALVAAVYSNRLRIGMGLQCDPTVIYALKLAGRWTGNLTREHLQMDSPYNTYRYAGLPPGPIASPGEASLEAALAPADVPYLYFVSRNDGSHAFASTLAEHNDNVRRYQVEYFRQKRLRDRAERGGA